MRARVVWLLCCLLSAVSGSSLAQDATIEVTEETLNRIVGRIGMRSDSGTHQPFSAERDEFMMCHPIGVLDCPTPDPSFPNLPGEIPLQVCRTYFGKVQILPIGTRVSYRWWVSDAHFTLKPGSMEFTATVRSQVDDTVEQTSRSVPATIELENGRLVVQLENFTVSLDYLDNGTVRTAAVVDVDSLYEISLDVPAQTLQVPALQSGGTAKEVRSTILNLLPVRYRLGTVTIPVNLQFSQQ